ncbi:glycosyltransferase family 4 protein [Thiocystis minor]|uniref:glycosyltransferase family 4 protein n=1 Tax=Thiocystis minor TaxID=61597 RepID=UPI0019137594|nr:glycosyltransferase family 4 protein [Thiocystis minor]
MKVLTVSEYGDPQVGGAERYLHETASRLRQRGLELTFLHADAGDPSVLHPPWRLFSGGYHPAWPRQIDRLLHTQRPDVIYAHFTVPGLVDVAVRRAARLKIPVCLVYHSDVTGAAWLKRRLGELYYRLIGRGTIARASALLISSPAYRAASPWLAEWERLPVFYAPPGVDAAIARGQRRADAPPYLLFVGKADAPGKGFDVLYRAWRRLRAAQPDLELIAVGAIPRRAYPGARFPGTIQDRRKLGDEYASALATVLPSLTSAESFGMVLAEALAAGCPVVGSQVGGIPALITPDENGYLAPPGDVTALTDALAQVIRHQGRLRANIARPQTLQRFSWETTTEQVWAALQTLIPPR